MNYWLVKTEPETYSWKNLVSDKKTTWDGVRNFQAKNHLKAMKPGDKVFVYHTGDEKAIVGIGTVSKEPFPEPNDTAWTAVELKPEKALKSPVTLSEVKADKRLSEMKLVRVARLSVQPVKKEEFDIIIAVSENR
ncbi:MAG TPA: EVE domain-containing protein [Chryseosolibacter sp.]|nr:EVE domain-containing protein [Chryseosolibacter sp.]